jgi:hypothetical protein
MGSAHLWVHNYSKTSATQTAAEQVRYLQRQGEFNPVSYLQRTSPHRKDYTDFVCGDTQNLPDWADEDAGKFFMQAQKSERVNGYYAVQVQFSLPKELTHAQQMALTQDFMQATMPDQPALWVKHDKRLDSGERHPHIHILLSARQMDEHQRSPEQTFARWDANAPEQGGAKKDLFWSKRQAPQQLREAFADITNYHLERERCQERIDVRRLNRRGIDRLPIRRGNPQPHEQARAEERRQAYEAWEQRKAYKSIPSAHDIPPEAFVLQVREWTRTFARGTAIHPATVRQFPGYEARLATQRQALEAQLYVTEQYHAKLVAEQVREAAHRQAGTARPLHSVVSVEALLLRGEQMDAAQGVGLRVSLEEEHHRVGYSR